MGVLPHGGQADSSNVWKKGGPDFPILGKIPDREGGRQASEADLRRKYGISVQETLPQAMKEKRSMTTKNENSNSPDNMELLKQEASACGPGCGCHAAGPSSRGRWIIGVVVLVAAGVLVARAIVKNNGASTDIRRLPDSRPWQPRPRRLARERNRHGCERNSRAFRTEHGGRRLRMRCLCFCPARASIRQAARRSDPERSADDESQGDARSASSP